MDFCELDSCLEKYKNQKGALIAILQEAQEIYGWLSQETLAHIAAQTGIPLAKITGVATFYAQFRDKPAGKYQILLCQGTACHVNGSARIEGSIREFLKTEEGEVTPDGLFSYNNVACIGCCSLSPAMLINGKTYARLTGEDSVNILKGFSQSN
jgi:NADH-quinone oxidoreductase subunit E